MTWSTKINFGKIFNIFHSEKMYLTFIIQKYLYFFALNQLNILIYLKTELLQKYTVKNQ